MTLARAALLLALLASTKIAHADGAEVGRHLAHTLTDDRGEPIILTSIVTYEPGHLRVYSQSREKLQALAERWQEHSHWGTIIVDGHAGPLAQQRADQIRGFLMRFGVPGDHIVARAAEHGPLEASVDLSIEVCETASACGREPLPAQLVRAQE